MNDKLASTGVDIPVFLQGGGELGELIRNHDWSHTSLGSVDQWPQSLRTCIQIMLTSRQPYWIGWGKDLIKFYNDPYKAIVGGKHPWALGKPASMVWNEIWRDIEPMLKKVMENNEGTYVESQLLIMERNGYPEETYYTFSYTPVAGDAGDVEGMICANSDDTDRILNERQFRTLTELGKAFIDAKTIQEVYDRTIGSLKNNPYDFPFALFYETSGPSLQLVSSSFARGKDFTAPDRLAFDDGSGLALLLMKAATLKAPVLMEDLRSYFGEMPSGAWSVSPEKAIILPIAQRGQKNTYGFLIVGLNPYRLLNEKYQSLFELIADQVATSIADVQSIEAERKRHEALAEIDRAKTIFFSNISHEFRTPLTLMLSPLQSLLESENLDIQQRRDLEISLRNTFRLQKLVNTLLDFSRIEAGRMEGNFRKVDLCQLTSDLASVFRSAIESAGIQYVVNCEKLHDRVTVDVDMWEKIVLNLISNAFKYTKNGKIEVTLRQEGKNVQLTVADTGIGISEADQARIFERFYRVNNSEGRSQEGTGIGLSMVKELVQLHEGSISVSSVNGKGSQFAVTIPVALQRQVTSEHLPEQPANLRNFFVEEAGKWASDGVNQDVGTNRQSPANRLFHDAPRVLLADDNADMREYVHRLLADDFEVKTVLNGEDALEVARTWSPDLIISDIMMPKLDGFGMLKKLRTTLGTRNTPVIFLSARAGEEAKIEGLQAGADDYLVKPFSARELISRVANHIAISRARRESELQFFNLFRQTPAHLHVMKGPDHVFEFFHPLAIPLIGKDLTGMKVREALPYLEGQGYFEMLDKVYHEGVSVNLPESPALIKDSVGNERKYYFSIAYMPWRDSAGKIQGVLQSSFDVTEQVRARLVIEEAESRLHHAVELAALGTWHIDLTSNHVQYSKRIAEWWQLPETGASLDLVIAQIHYEDREKVSKAVNRALTETGNYAIEYRLQPPDGPLRYIHANGSVFYDEDKKPVRLSGIARDVTPQTITQHELEQKVRDRTQELLDLNKELSRSNEELRQFAYVASHDLQEPLRKIQTFSELTKRRLDDPLYVSNYLTKIDNSAARMAALIKDVLLYSQVTRHEIETEVFPLSEVIDHVRNDFELLIEEKGATITYANLPLLQANRLHFYQLFSNLISNSLKFSSVSPYISISHEIVAGHESEHPKLDINERYHSISVRDNGIGFDQAYAEQIFGLFNRLHNKQDYSGTGIGLALCRKIVEGYRGAIKASSRKGEGAVFTIYLPEALSEFKSGTR